MAYFAVISETPKALRVIRCHINVWALSGLFGRTAFFFDVGLGMRAAAGSTGVKKFQLALPFSVSTSGGFKDLRSKLHDAQTARLILGQPVQIDGDDVSFESTPKETVGSPAKVTPKPSRTTLRTVAVPHPRLDADKSTDKYSVWEVELPSAIEPSDSPAETYIRVRFRVRSFSRAWVAQSSGALVDLRISDIREALAGPQWDSFERQIVEIETLNLFVIAPSTLKMRAASPALRYVRLLEGPLWEKYLERKLQLFRKKKLVIYYWRSEGPVGHNKPFMGFLDLAKEQAALGFWNYFFFVFLSALVAAAALGVYLHFAQLLTQGAAWVYVKNILSGVGALGVIKVLVEAVRVAREKYSVVSQIVQTIEDLLYKKHTD